MTCHWTHHRLISVCFGSPCGSPSFTCEISTFIEKQVDSTPQAERLLWLCKTFLLGLSAHLSYLHGRILPWHCWGQGYPCPGYEKNWGVSLLAGVPLPLAGSGRGLWADPVTGLGAQPGNLGPETWYPLERTWDQTPWYPLLCPLRADEQTENITYPKQVVKLCKIGIWFIKLAGSGWGWSVAHPRLSVNVD